MRVANSTMQQAMLMELQRAQASFADAQTQVASGKVGSDLKDFGSKAEVVAAGRLAQARTEHRISLATEVANRFDVQAAALTSVGSVAQNLQQDIMNAIGANSGAGVSTAIGTAFAQALNGLNIQVNGQYYFGGTRSDTAPINIATIDQLGAAATVDSIFSNNASKPTVDLGDGPIETGQLASDISKPLFQAIKNIKDYITANGAFSSPMTQAQSAFLTAQLPNLKSAASTIVDAEGLNGVNQKRAETAHSHQDDLRIALTDFVSNVEDVDIAAAATRMQQSQLAYEASAQTLSQLSRLSLLDFLR